MMVANVEPLQVEPLESLRKVMLVAEVATVNINKITTTKRCCIALKLRRK
jgi:hypothetical protein